MKPEGRKVECPVKGCAHKVARRKGPLKRAGRYRCPEHGIYISPATFEYEYAVDNLLWHGAEDLRILNGTGQAGPGSAMARDNGEDAIIWNVFRFLDKTNLVSPVLGTLAEVELDHPRVIYWSFHPGEGSNWSQLEAARREFGEKPKNAAAPEIIIDAQNAVLFVVPKLLSENISRPPRGARSSKFLKAGQHWFPRVFEAGYEAVAVEGKRYDLMRFWLLGTWMAARRGADFRLICLTRQGREEGLAEDFERYISTDAARKFKHITWEEIYRGIRDSGAKGAERERILRYFEEKTVGYGRKGILSKAFQV